MKTLRPIVSVLALAGGLLLSMPLLAESPGPSATPSAKIAVVDIQRAALETEDGLRAQAQLRKYFDRRQAELNARQDDLLRKKDEIERQSKVLSKEIADQMVERLPKARLVEIADAGHQVPLHQPEEFSRVIREFLAE